MSGKPPAPRFALPTLLGLLAACEGPGDLQPGDGLPPLAWEGERVRLGTNLVDEVCRGTLVNLDSHVESIELVLGLAPSSEEISFYVLDDDTFAERCDADGPVLACVREHDVVYSTASGWENRRHELVHARLGQERIRSVPLFDEGVAAALDQDGGCLASPACVEASLDELLSVGTTAELLSLGGYAAGADLVHGILLSYGPEALLAFMDEVTSDDSPDVIRSLYFDAFGGQLDVDFEAFKRSVHADYTLGQLGCEALVSGPAFGSDAGIEITATMDCESPDVVNVFWEPGSGHVEWLIPIGPEQAGAFALSATDGASLAGCRPPRFNHQELLDHGPWDIAWYSGSEVDQVRLFQGMYKLRWTAEFGRELTFDMGSPCSFEQQDCPGAEQCTIWNECEPAAASPAQLGESCQQDGDQPLVCAAGSRCSGGVCVAECDATQACVAGQACTRFRVCGAVCELLAQDCELGFACVPAGDEQLNLAGLGVCVAEGEAELLEACDPSESSCRAGLSCEFPGNCMGGAQACCVPLCEGAGGVDGCAGSFSTCDPIRDGPVGVCRSGPA